MRTLWSILFSLWGFGLFCTFINTLAQTNTGLAGGITVLTVIIWAGYAASRQ
jgi:hypothetical protein